MRTSVLVVSAEPVGARMAGPAIRAYELARALAATCDVTLAAPPPSTVADPRVALVAAGMADVEALVAAAREHDVVVAQELPPVALERLAGGPARLVADLYNPIVVELLAGGAGRPVRAQRRIHGRIVARTVALCAAADLVICANERQRDLWIGGMALRGLIDGASYRRDPTLRSLVEVVPFGLPDGPAPAAGGALRDSVPRDRRGRPRARLGRRRVGLAGPAHPDAGGRAPGGARRPAACTSSCSALGRPGLEASGQAAAGEEAVAAARRAGLLDRLVHVNPGWVPYDERGAWLAEADVGVTAHHDHLEARYAHRTRILDYLWAGLPVVASRGDALAELVERERPRGRRRARGRGRLRGGLRADAGPRRRRGTRADRRARAVAALERGRGAAGRMVRERGGSARGAPPTARSCAARRWRSTAGRCPRPWPRRDRAPRRGAWGGACDEPCGCDERRAAPRPPRSDGAGGTRGARRRCRCSCSPRC